MLAQRLDTADSLSILFLNKFYHSLQNFEYDVCSLPLAIVGQTSSDWELSFRPLTSSAKAVRNEIKMSSANTMSTTRSTTVPKAPAVWSKPIRNGTLSVEYTISIATTRSHFTFRGAIGCTIHLRSCKGVSSEPSESTDFDESIVRFLQERRRLVYEHVVEPGEGSRKVLRRCVTKKGLVLAHTATLALPKKAGRKGLPPRTRIRQRRRTEERADPKRSDFLGPACVYLSVVTARDLEVRCCDKLSCIYYLCASEAARPI